jgi:hypothetical protein
MDERQRTVLKIRTSNEEFYRCFNQGVQDMAALRLPLKGVDHMVFRPPGCRGSWRCSAGTR